MKRRLLYFGAILGMSLAAFGCGTELEEIAISESLEIVGEILDEQSGNLEDTQTEDGQIESDSEEYINESAANPEEEYLDLESANLSEEDFVEDSYVEEESLGAFEDVSIEEGGSYTTKEEVALYIYTYGELPANFITKSEAQDLGWVSKEGNLWDVAPGMSIGGDRYGNYEQILPDGKYKECDINYNGGYRGDERIVYSADGYIYYTDDHYESFTQLYPIAE